VHSQGAGAMPWQCQSMRANVRHLASESFRQAPGLPDQQVGFQRHLRERFRQRDRRIAIWAFQFPYQERRCSFGLDLSQSTGDTPTEANLLKSMLAQIPEKIVLLRVVNNSGTPSAEVWHRFCISLF